MALTKLTGRFLSSFSHHQYQLRALLTTTARLRQNVESSETPGASEGAENLETAFPALETPMMTSRTLKFPVDHTYPRLAWVESMDTLQGTKLGMLDLHPDIFAVYPRIDILHKNVHWQRMYRHIDYNFEPTRAEMPGGGRKPWPQKGLGKARHGSCRSPIWIQGAKAHGPRGPKSHFYMLSRAARVLGLRTALSCKYTQNDIVIVDSFDIPTSEPEWLQELTDIRFWGYSILFVDDTDVMPENIEIAVSQIRGFSIMPAYGLNVHSMLKHDTLVLTLAALEKIEGKLLDECHTTSRMEKFVNTLRPEDFRKHPKEDTLMLKRFTAHIDTKEH